LEDGLGNVPYFFATILFFNLTIKDKGIAALANAHWVAHKKEANNINGIII